ncbi:two-component response regulator [Tolypothrix tenuis PCC 7101]|uniref:Two-component response regulator n=1 Tax=Tolypothrix tenuis PCC 7101 TaxID=231146 RepID=A0A1Z4MS73_9CYAN|nr:MULTISPECIES: response regulator transcription factor [unclassified Tolypothrix]MBD2236492.1 response regulator transcription factor [Aulosira sp. FACHB-113]BAY94269.1 two-component response regulator [Microchaete diplosiphon NIES-3275]BAY96327.1 two-component response regulator [Tolypothrix tenuis PCC 7101]BAZ73166.1 two-component response regulator [Aulosira laxa NIES-50]MBE9085608.1 response regulator transcription factor [Tolypothrix sp. LEGE 11397]
MDTIRVVLIEDHDLTRMGMRTALKQQEGIEVIGEAKNANSGLKLLNSLQPDVAIVDVGLPDMSGVELTQIFKDSEDADSPLPTKILILTMNDSEDTVLAAFAAGADSYYMKDASIEKLADAIRVTHEGNSWIDPAIARIVLQQSNSAYDEPNAGSKSSTVTINSLSPEESEFLLAYPLTTRELDVLRLIVDGCSNAQIAEQLYITVGTVKTHVRNILNKLSVSDRTQVAVRALRAGLVS